MKKLQPPDVITFDLVGPRLLAAATSWMVLGFPLTGESG